MKTRLLIGFLSLFIFTACKNEPQTGAPAEQQQAPAKPVINPEIFTITLTAVVKKDDSFQVYFKSEDGAAYDEKHSIFKEFKGSETPQDIVFELPETEEPSFIRLDLGVNKQQDPIVVKSFKINYAGKEVVLNEKEFFDYFIANDKTVKTDKAASTFTPIAGDSYDPMIFSGTLLSDKIAAMLKP